MPAKTTRRRRAASPLSRTVSDLEVRVEYVISAIEHLNYQCEVNLRRCGELQRELDLLKKQTIASSAI
jgi:hypothetical protein